MFPHKAKETNMIETIKKLKTSVHTDILSGFYCFTYICKRHGEKNIPRGYWVGAGVVLQVQEGPR